MRANELAAPEARLGAFLEGLTGFLGRRDRRAWAGAYVRGLLLDGERKSAEPMAARLGRSKQGLQQFVSQSPSVGGGAPTRVSREGGASARPRLLDHRRDQFPQGR